MVKRTIRHPAHPLTAVVAITVALAAAAVASVLLLGRAGGLPPIAAPGTIVAHAEFDPAAPGFGDRIEAKIVIALNRRAVRPRTLRYSYGLAPLTQLGRARVSRSTSGKVELVTLVMPVVCVTGPCVSRDGVATLHLAPVRASVSRVHGARTTDTARWPALTVRGRVLKSDLNAASPPFEADTSPASPSYSISPSTLSTLLDVLAAVCAVAAVALLGWQAVVFVRRRSAPDADALARALRLTREAQRLPVPHRRRAVGLLARLLGRDQLSGAASDLAWSEHAPEPDELATLVAEIEGRD